MFYNGIDMWKFNGSKLKTRRKELSLTQSQLAELVLGEPKYSVVANWENGFANPSAESLIALARSLKLKPEHLGDEASEATA